MFSCEQSTFSCEQSAFSCEQSTFSCEQSMFSCEQSMFSCEQSSTFTPTTDKGPSCCAHLSSQVQFMEAKQRLGELREESEERDRENAHLQSRMHNLSGQCEEQLSRQQQVGPPAGWG